jgi:hypothetical protein
MYACTHEARHIFHFSELVTPRRNDFTSSTSGGKKERKKDRQTETFTHRLVPPHAASRLAWLGCTLEKRKQNHETM